MKFSTRSAALLGLAVALLQIFSTLVFAQQGAAAATPASTAKATSPIDLAGYWVSLITEDWRFRMVTPPKGENPDIPLTAEGKRVFDSWDPAKDQTAGEQCKAFGGANIMRMPGRLHITWENDNTLRVDTEAGTQTRMFRFSSAQPAGGPRSWQGNSIAQWEFAGGRAQRGGGADLQRTDYSKGNLKVVTTNLRAGYLQANGVPYSENALVTEYLHVAKAPNSDEWLFVTTVVEDPQYLGARFIRSSHFKRLPDGSAWKPVSCSAS